MNFLGLEMARVKAVVLYSAPKENSNVPSETLATSVKCGRAAKGHLVVRGLLEEVRHDGIPFMMTTPGILASVASTTVKWDVQEKHRYEGVFYCPRVIEDGDGYYDGLVLESVLRM